MSLAPRTEEWVSPEEFLAGERVSDCRHEYLEGIVYAMAGTSDEHNLIAGNIFALAHGALLGKPCHAYINDMKVKLEAAGRDVFYYPDVMISCGPTGEPRYFKTDPAVIFEVLSPATEGIDRREKFFAYTSLPSLQAYILVEQEKIGVTLFRRGEAAWRKEQLESLEAVVRLELLGLELPLSAIYDRVF
jgi:Uma2 family endonuclease